MTDDQLPLQVGQLSGYPKPRKEAHTLIEKARIDKIVLITRRNKSDLIRDALFEYFQKFEGII
jgi:hypothetical protein